MLLFLLPVLSLALYPSSLVSSRRSRLAMAACAVGSIGAGKCVPCSSMDPSFLLSNEVVDHRLQGSAWSRQSSQLMVDDEEKHVQFLSRQFTAKNFQCALDCVNECGAIAEREQHHPNFHLTNYRDVQIDIWTHKLGGITENDLALAAMFDAEVTIQYSPKWLRENPHAKPAGK